MSTRSALLLAERAERQNERAERRSESATAKIEVARRDAELANRLIEIEHLKAMLAKLRRGKYGSSSEKLDAEKQRPLTVWPPRRLECPRLRRPRAARRAQLSLRAVLNQSKGQSFTVPPHHQ